MKPTLSLILSLVPQGSYSKTLSSSVAKARGGATSMRLTNQLGTFFTNEKQAWDFHWPRGMRAFLLGSLAGQWVDTGVRAHLALVSWGILNQSKNGKKTETIKLEKPLCSLWAWHLYGFLLPGGEKLRSHSRSEGGFEPWPTGASHCALSC